MTTLTVLSSVQTEAPRPGTWGATLLAGLPHLLMGLLIGVGKIRVSDASEVTNSGQIISYIGLILLVAGMLFVAWRLGWPLWSASWYIYGTWAILVITGLAIEGLGLRESWRYTNAAIISWVLLAIIGYLMLVYKSKLHGLLAIAFLFPFLSILMLEFIPDWIEGWLAIGVGLLAAVVAAVVVRFGELRLGLALVLGLNLAAGLAWAYISEYKMLDLPAGVPAHTPSLIAFFGMLALYSIFSLGVVALPFIIRGLWKLGRRPLSS